jgi:hypothetical protein
MPHLAVLRLAEMRLGLRSHVTPHLVAPPHAQPRLAELRLDPRRVRCLRACAVTGRRARFVSSGRQVDPDKPGSHVSSRADLDSRQVGVRPRVAPHGLPAAPLAGSASRRGDCTAACWLSGSS